ncbi:SRPBCC family protein [Luteimonas sp. SX5]|uniref:SRPBCC family protein n=1 Tax=Luteimonas galliterrae TaxID=2940486 RepID=A0ABT0MGF7_9GAMM|nr:SRPBCC family protein [Luteimonas galliterrae]MCL1633400.1 SRPBCC family protein [Luteimonas galliterrae]
MSDTDRIVKQAVLKASLERVWQAISDSKRFGTWFGAEFDGPFVAGARLTGRIVPTAVDPEIGRMQAPYAGTPFEISIERIEPMRVFALRWHPNAVEPGKDYSEEPTTLVVFELEETEGGTRLTLTESGYDKIPLARRAEAFESNEQGWEMQMTLIAKYLAQAS